MNAPSLAPHQAQWVSLVRYQLVQAHQQAEQPAPLSSLALSTMQDAAESVMHLCAEKLGVTLGTREDFDAQVAKVVAAHSGSDLGAFTNGLRAMNRARVGFKHSGNRADDTTVRQHLATTQSAIEAFLNAVFDVELSDVSMLLLVPDRDVRDRLALAHWHRDRNDWANAASDLAMAMATLVREYHGGETDWPSALSTGPASFWESDTYPRETETAQHLLAHDEWLRRLDERVVVMSAGVDAVDSVKFEGIIGELTTLPQGGFEMTTTTGPIAEDEWSWAVQFVIDTALRFAAHPFWIQVSRGEQIQVVRSAAEDAALMECARRPAST